MPTTTPFLTSSAWRESGTELQINVGFMVEDLDMTQAPAALMIQARNQLPANGTTYAAYAGTLSSTAPGLTDPRSTTARLQGVVFNGNTTNVVSGTMTFSTITGLTPTTLIVTQTTRTLTVSTNQGPDGSLISVFYDGNGGSTGATPPPNGYPLGAIPTDYIQHSVRVPTGAVIVEGINYGAPDDTMEQFVGSVIAPDTFRGRAPGSWMVDAYESVYSVYQGISTYRTALVSAPGKARWWLTAVLQDRNSGRYATYPGLEQKIKTALSGSYAAGQQAPAGAGFSVFGWYPTVSVSQLRLPSQAA